MLSRRPLNRIAPRLPVTAMQTHAILSPIRTHFRPATCVEVECRHYEHGWTLRTAGLAADMVAAARHSGRHYTETADEHGAPVLHFAAGQPCFRASEHRVRLDREPVYLKRNGDWRGDPDGLSAAPVRLSGPDAFADSLHTATGG